MDNVTDFDRPYILPTDFTPGKIGVVTITYNSAGVLDGFFNSISKQTYQNFVVYVIDNASRDATLSMCEAYHDRPTVILANSDNVGVAAGNNQGIKAALAAGCEYVLLLNNDVEFEPELFARMVEGLGTYGCEMTTPKMYFFDPPNMIWCAGGGFHPSLGYANYHRGGHQIDTGQFDEAVPVAYAPTCCVLFAREVFAKVGLMDERYFVYRDDTDFLFRAQKLGLTMYYLPNAKLWHKVSALTVKGSAFDLRYGTRNRAYFLAKHFSKLVCFAYTLLYMAMYFSQVLRRKIDLPTFKLKTKFWREGLAMVKG